MTNMELKKLRVGCVLSQREMAQLIGVGVRTYQGWESPRRKKPIPDHVTGRIETVLKSLDLAWVKARLAAYEEYREEYEEWLAIREAARGVPLASNIL